MFKNYVITALRQFSRHKLFSALNIFCLATGISFCLLIGQYIIKEHGIDANLNDVKNQYFLNSNWKIKDFGLEMTTVGPAVKSTEKQLPRTGRKLFSVQSGSKCSLCR